MQNFDSLMINFETTNLLHIFWSNGKQVHLVSQSFACLDSGNVGVDHHGVNPLLFQSLDCLGARVVKLSSLTDGQSP